MADNEARLRIIIDAINNAGDELKALQDDLNKTGEKAKESGEKAGGSKDKFGELASKFEELTGVSIPTAVTLGGVGAAVGAIYAIVDGSVNRFGEYAEQVRGLSYAYDLTSEQASTLVQVLDDVRVKPASLETAFRSMADKGIQPTIENLADLADQFVSIQDPVEKSAFLADTFGQRAGPEMAKALSLGGYALRQYAQDAEDAGLLLSDADLAASERLKQAQDRLADAQVQFDKTVGLGGTQVYTELLDVAGDAWDQVSQWMDDLFPKQQTQYEWVQETGRAYAEMTGEAERELNRLTIGHQDATTAAQDQAAAASALKEKYSDLQILMAGKLGKENDRFETKMGSLEEKAADLKARLDELNRTNGQYYEYTKNSGISANELALAQLQLSDAQARLANETDTEKQLRLNIQIEKLQSTVSGASEVVKGYINNSKDISELSTEYQEVEDAIRNEKLEHQRATRSIIFDILLRKAAEDDYKTITLDFLAGVGEKWGVLDHDTAVALANINSGLEIAKGNAGDFVGYMESKINGAIWRATVETRYTKVGDENFGGWTPPANGGGSTTPKPEQVVTPVSGAYASGGSFVVPGNGTGDRPYMVNLTPGETVNVTPAGRPGGGGSGATVNATFLILSEADKERMAYDLVNIIANRS